MPTPSPIYSAFEGPIDERAVQAAVANVVDHLAHEAPDSPRRVSEVRRVRVERLDDYKGDGKRWTRIALYFD